MEIMTLYLLGKTNCSTAKLHVLGPEMTYYVIEENSLPSAQQNRTEELVVYIESTHCPVAGVG